MEKKITVNRLLAMEKSLRERLARNRGKPFCRVFTDAKERVDARTYFSFTRGKH